MTNPLVDAALERAYLGDLLIGSDRESWARHIAAPDRLQPADLAVSAHQRILGAIHELAAERQEVSSLTVRAMLERRSEIAAAHVLEAIWVAYEPTIDSYAAMARRLHELARARRTDALLRMALEATQRLHLEAAEEMAREVLGDGSQGRVEAISLHSAAVARTASTSRPTGGVRTTIELLDRSIGRLRPGSMVTVGGRTGAGKSTLMLAMALGMARQGHKPGIVSCEDPAELWGERALCHVSDFGPHDLEQAQPSLGLRSRIDAALSAIPGVQLACVLNRPLEDVLAAVRDLLANKRCDVILVDYLQAIRLGHIARRAELVSAAAQRIKSECQRHGVPLILGSQLSRPDKAKPFAEPHCYELKESGDLENMSEVVLLLWKTSDESSARMLGKVAKVKWSPRRPRFEMRLAPNGALASVEYYEAPEEMTESHGWGRSGAYEQ
jgi:replicative DNA helicase